MAGSITAFNPSELARYGRQIVLPEIGLEGQQKLRAASVLIVGAGGLGSPAALYLAAAGVGRLGLVEFDAVEASNLHRQILYGTRDIGRPKLVVARERLADLNPHVEIVTHPGRLDASNARELIRAYDLVLDGTDNFATRYLVNDAATLERRPNVYGSIFRFEGQVSVFDATRGPCYRCLFPEPPPDGAVPNCAEGGVLGVLPGIVGSLQATEAIKLIVGCGEPLLGRLLLIDALEMRFRELVLRRVTDCALCGETPTIQEVQDLAVACGVAEPVTESDIEPHELRLRLQNADPPVLLDVRANFERTICRLPGETWIPLNALAARRHELDPEREVVVYCHHGGRSQAAVEFLRREGFARARNLVGGIDAWAKTVEPTMPRY